MAPDRFVALFESARSLQPLLNLVQPPWHLSAGTTASFGITSCKVLDDDPSVEPDEPLREIALLSLPSDPFEAVHRPMGGFFFFSLGGSGLTADFLMICKICLSSRSL